MSILAFTLTGVALIFCIPVAVLFIEVMAAVVLREREHPEDDANTPRPRIAVLIPAHDESAGLAPTISDVQAQLHPEDRLLVVADNCSDDTAKIARSMGAEVVERHDPEKIGKGYALDWGVRYLQDDPPDIVIVVDADCRLPEHVLDELAITCAVTGQPTQALYHMKEAPGAECMAEQRVSQFAWIVKTHVRPIGLVKLGLPCQLMGTGMAFPWQAIQSVQLASANLVEDLKLGLDLASVGSAPRLCSQTYVESTFPISESGRLTQRQRWEVGSLRMLTAQVPMFLWRALLDRNLPLFVLALDALVPPLVVLATILVAFLVVAALAAIAGMGIAALVTTSAALILFATSLLLAWSAYGRTVLGARDAAHLPAYLLQKLRIYRTRPSRSWRWVRTDRGRRARKKLLGD